MYTLTQFDADYPLRSARIAGGEFTYRYHRNPRAKATLVLLTGGIGFSDLFYLNFHLFARHFSVLTFDYHIQYPTIAAFADAAAELMHTLGIRGFLVGQSLGGIVAQIIARRHPEVVEGLVLSNTCGLAAEMSPASRKALTKILVGQKLMGVLVRILPFSLYKKMCRGMLLRFGTADFSPEEHRFLNGIGDAVLRLMNRPYELHMISLLLDTARCADLTPADFAPWRDRILLIQSDDDDTFPAPVKADLLALMPGAEVVTSLTGGHLTLLIRPEEYLRAVSGFILR